MPTAQWLVILPQPCGKREIVGRHHTRNEAEHHAQKLNRLMGGFQLTVINANAIEVIQS